MNDVEIPNNNNKNLNSVILNSIDYKVPFSAQNHLTCINCNLSFNTFEQQKCHFKTDFHRYNLKRSTVGLPPVEYELFVKKREKLANSTVSDNISVLNQSSADNDSHTILSNNILTCALCKKHYKSKNALNSHFGSKIHKLNLEKADSNSTISIDSQMENEDLSDYNSSSRHTPNIPLAVTKPRKHVKREWRMKSDLLCLYCDEESHDLESNLIHMYNCHSFRIPYPSEVQNMHELLYYLHHKCHKLKLCIYCNKQFHSYWNIRRHMGDMNHMQMDVGDDNPEYDVFYGYGGDEEEQKDMEEHMEVIKEVKGERKHHQNKMGEEEEWESVEEEEGKMGEDGKWVDMEDDEGEGSEESHGDPTRIKIDVTLNDKVSLTEYIKKVDNKVDKPINKKQKEGVENGVNASVAEPEQRSYGFYLDFWKRNKVNSTGELELEDGSTLGHKDFKLVYKQKPVFLHMLKFNTYMQCLKEHADVDGNYKAFESRLRKMKTQSLATAANGVHSHVLDVIRSSPYKWLKLEHKPKTHSHIYEKNKDSIKASLHRNQQEYFRDQTLVY